MIPNLKQQTLRTGTPYNGVLPPPKRKRVAHVDLAAIDAKAKEDNAAADAEAKARADAEEAERVKQEAERHAKAVEDANHALYGPGGKPQPDEAATGATEAPPAEEEPPAEGQDIAGALAAAAKAENQVATPDLTPAQKKAAKKAAKAEAEQSEK